MQALGRASDEISEHKLTSTEEIMIVSDAARTHSSEVYVIFGRIVLSADVIAPNKRRIRSSG
ncbi:MAG: hypothetical protein QXP42_00350 [Candidatus Micrarchaeia archaeon]